jgi:hypothetical protein
MTMACLERYCRYQRGKWEAINQRTYNAIAKRKHYNGNKKTNERKANGQSETVN